MSRLELAIDLTRLAALRLDCIQGFTEAARGQMKVVFHNGDEKAKLTVSQEALSGVIGGALACWNHPFEVARIEAQAAAAAGEKSVGMVGVLSNVVAKEGVGGLFAGIVPRLCLGIYQTLFMVTGAKLIRQYID